MEDIFDDLPNLFDLPELEKSVVISKKIRNNTRKNICPNCKNTISTNGLNFIFHVKKCDEKMAKEMYPELYEKLEQHIVKSTLKRLNTDLTTVNNGFLAYVEIKEETKDGRVIIITNQKGEKIEAFTKKTNNDYMYGS